MWGNILQLENKYLIKYEHLYEIFLTVHAQMRKHVFFHKLVVNYIEQPI